MIDIPKNKKVILFDGICNLCNNSVAKVIRFDKKNTFLFAAIQSDAGKQIIDYLKIDTSKIDSIILYEPNVSYDVKSTAALKVMQDFGGIWQLTFLLWIFPEGFRNFVYDFIAKNLDKYVSEYLWFVEAITTQKSKD